MILEHQIWDSAGTVAVFAQRFQCCELKRELGKLGSLSFLSSHSLSATSLASALVPVFGREGLQALS